uniref:6-phosphogluconolactonase n=1 Tax=uncultured Thiotrichaceae bacterium TaxID=298394 RepID=A0A6S6SUG2_9GAMM|nr:MAG: 6-phosphogluconolactonase (EC, eukaryotic type [uncultured Thiotrichaceae bacterium]
MNIIQYSDRKEQAEALAAQVAGQLRAVISAGGKAGIALSGGSTPAPFMQALATHSLDWSGVNVTLTDERCVDDTHERSNARLVKENLLGAVPDATFFPLFPGECVDAALLAKESVLSEMLPATACVLGMGPDGHFASLFPEADQLAEGLDVDNARLTLPMQVPGVPDIRISLTLQAILKSASLHLLITGEEKLAVLKQAEADKEAGDFPLPVCHLLQHAGERLVIHYAD